MRSLSRPDARTSSALTWTLCSVWLVLRLEQLLEALRRGGDAQHQRHPHQPIFGAAQQKPLHDGLGFGRRRARAHAAVRFVDHHIEAVGRGQGGGGERLPDGMLAFVALARQQFVRAELLGVHEVDGAARQPFGVEGGRRR